MGEKEARSVKDCSDWFSFFYGRIDVHPEGNLSERETKWGKGVYKEQIRVRFFFAKLRTLVMLICL